MAAKPKPIKSEKKLKSAKKLEKTQALTITMLRRSPFGK